MRRSLVMVVLTILLISACQEQTSEGPKGIASTRFLGGSAGIVPEFLPGNPPPEVYDGGSFPFDVVVRLTNKGEFPVPASRVKVMISGILAPEFSVSSGALVSGPSEDVLARQQDAEGNILEPSPSFAEFVGLNHRAPIVGSVQRFPLQASVCYNYGTVASTTLCSRENILDPDENGICTINEDKTVENSGAPVQISSVRESARAADRVGFTFKIMHAGQGEIYAPASGCDKVDRRNENRVAVRVSSGIPGLSCSGLEGGADGTTTLFGGEKTITCTQQIPSSADFEFPVTIEAAYDYEDRITTEIAVKRSETRVGQAP